MKGSQEINPFSGMKSLNDELFLKNKKILHNDNVHNFNDGILFLIENENNTDIITYNMNEKITLNVENLSVDENNNYFYEYIFNRTYDIIDDININLSTSESPENIEISYYVGGQMYNMDEIKRIFFISFPYQEFRIRIIFREKEKEKIMKNIEIRSRIYLLTPKCRKTGETYDEGGIIGGFREWNRITNPMFLHIDSPDSTFQELILFPIWKFPIFSHFVSDVLPL